ncbi:MAG: hypothetical protein JXR54_09995 [Tannerellaceae bacterium]|nr:hypothetical protein [Tannerellaceae bacterium]
MLYIDYLGNNTVRFGDAVGGGTNQKVFGNTLAARCAEPVGDDTTGRVWIQDTETGFEVLNNTKTSDITLNGAVYSDCGAFVQAFAASIAGETLVTTTSTTAAATTTTTAAVTTTTTTAA